VSSSRFRHDKTSDLRLITERLDFAGTVAAATWAPDLKRPLGLDWTNTDTPHSLT